METTDQQDIQDSLNGDGEAYARIIRRYENDIARLMWRFSRIPYECQELVQDVFVEAYFSLGGFRGQAPLLHWLRRIGSRVGFRFWKQKRSRTKNISLLDVDGAEPVAHESDAEKAGEILDGLLAQLNPKDRLVLTLCYFERCSIVQVADMMGWNEAMVKMRVHRAKKKLKKIAENSNIEQELL